MNIDPAAFFAALAHPTRLRCLGLLLDGSELCVCEFTAILGAAQPHVSRHLGALRELGLVADRRDGLWIHYRLHPELPGWAASVLRTTLQACGGQQPFADDRAALRTLTQQGERSACL